MWHSFSTPDNFICYKFYYNRNEYSLFSLKKLVWACYILFNLWLFFFLTVLRLEYKTLQLLGWCSIRWSMPPSHFTLLIFWIWSCDYSQSDLDHDLPMYASAWLLWQVHHYNPFFNGWNGISLTFHLGWSQTTILPISTLQVDRIICMSHHAWCNHLLLIWTYFYT
jgi:hypothetical protein